MKLTVEEKKRLQSENDEEIYDSCYGVIDDLISAHERGVWKKTCPYCKNSAICSEAIGTLKSFETCPLRESK
jgi:hypothetical protein